MGWDYNSHIVCMCIIMRWSRNRSAIWAERFRTSSLLCTYKLCDYYSPIPILSPFFFTPSLYAPILNLQDFSFTCLYSYITPFIMYSLRHLLLFTGKQGCLQTCKYDQSLSVTENYVPTKFHVDIWFPF